MFGNRKPLPKSAVRVLRFSPTAIGFLLVVGNLVYAQDTRNVSEPSFPQSCSVLSAELSIENGEPSSETEFDTRRIQNELNSCAQGKAVELVSANSNHAFLIQPIKIPAGVTLLVDAGVTVFASRNPADYQNSGAAKCGVVSNNGGGCHALLSSTKTSGSGIMGYGVIDGRGWDHLIVNGSTQDYSWYSNTLKAYVPRPVLNQNNFDMIELSEASDFTLYKITIKDSPEFNIHWYGSNGGAVTHGLTIWGIKIIAPNNISNTDGIDPTDNSSDVTITDSFISNGDDNIALSSTVEGNPISNVSISNLHTYSGFGISIGSHTEGGVDHVLVDNVVQSGWFPNKGSAGLKIKSSSDRGGVVSNVTYRHVCQQNESAAIRIYPWYTKPSTTAHIPTYSNVTFSDVTVLANPEGGAGSFTFQGYDANHRTTLTLDNVNVLGKPDLSSGKPENAEISLGPGPVNPTSLQEVSGSGVSIEGHVQNEGEAPYPCSSGSFQPLAGELSLATASAHNLQSLTGDNASSFALQAVLEPASAEYAALTQPITFYDGSTAVGTAALGGNGTLAEVTLSNVAAGTHTYSAQYPADENYSEYAFGLVTVDVPGKISSPELVSAYVVAKGRANSMMLGGTLQFTAYAKYADGSVNALPDSYGNAVTGWNTSNHSVAKISMQGHATAVGLGTVDIEAAIGGIKAAPWTVSVGAASSD